MDYAQSLCDTNDAGLAVFTPTAPERNVGHWRINGFRASLFVWTAEEWDRLADRPRDAQYFSCGVWCALRMDE